MFERAHAFWAALSLAFLVLTSLAATTPVTRANAQTGSEAELLNNGGGATLGRSGLKLPRFVSLRAVEVNMRTGPGTRYPIDWVYRRRNLPVEIIDEFDTWRRIRDAEGTVGWVHQSMLQGKRFVLVTEANGILLRRDPQEDARSVARLEAGVIGQLETCGELWCVVEADGFKGWLERTQVYGIYREEEVR